MLERSQGVGSVALKVVDEAPRNERLYVPEFVLKSQFTDVIGLGLADFEQEIGLTVGCSRAWWQGLLRR